MDDILSALDRLNIFQLMLAWAFVGCYALALGGMLGTRGSWRAGVMALFSAALFCALGEYWVHSALLVLFAVAGMGLFVAAAWVLMQLAAWYVRRGEQPEPVTTAPAPAESPAPSMAGLRALWRSYVGG